MLSALIGLSDNILPELTDDFSSVKLVPFSPPHPLPGQFIFFYKAILSVHTIGLHTEGSLASTGVRGVGSGHKQTAMNWSH